MSMNWVEPLPLPNQLDEVFFKKYGVIAPDSIQYKQWWAKNLNKSQKN